MYVKYVVSNSSMCTLDQSFYQNLFSIPILVFIVLFTEIGTVRLPKLWTNLDLIMFLFSCLLGLGLSILSFDVRKLISATSFSVLGNTCKLAMIAINLLIWDDHRTTHR